MSITLSNWLPCNCLYAVWDALQQRFSTFLDSRTAYIIIYYCLSVADHHCKFCHLNCQNRSVSVFIITLTKFKSSHCSRTTRHMSALTTGGPQTTGWEQLLCSHHLVRHIMSEFGTKTVSIIGDYLLTNWRLCLCQPMMLQLHLHLYLYLSV